MVRQQGAAQAAVQSAVARSEKVVCRLLCRLLLAVRWRSQGLAKVLWRVVCKLHYGGKGAVQGGVQAALHSAVAKCRVLCRLLRSRTGILGFKIGKRVATQGRLVGFDSTLIVECCCRCSCLRCGANFSLGNITGRPGFECSSCFWMPYFYVNLVHLIG